MTKKLLVFTASTGGGHNKAAESLKELFEIDEYSVEIIDLFHETNRILDSFITDGYDILVKHFPKTYSELYKLSNKKRVNLLITRSISILIQYKLYKRIEAEKADLIIATHPFAVKIVGDLKGKKLIALPFISIVTDYKAHQTYINEAVDAYITGSHYTKQTFINKGVQGDKIYHYGIPIRKEFLEYKFNEDLKKSSDQFTVLLMAGSMGLNIMEKTLKYMLTSDELFRIIVVCGSNKELECKIALKYKNQLENKEISLFGYVEHIYELMRESDVIVSKPGGLTVTESIAANIPMVIPYMIPGQETENADFLEHEGVAIRISDISNIGNVIDGLIHEPQHLQEMKKNIMRLRSDYSLERIVVLGNKLINQYKDGIGR